MPIELTGTEGPLPPGEVVVVVSRYHAGITDNLLRGATETLRAAGMADDQLRVARVPGAWELPLASRQAIDADGVIGAIALGAVIKGETTHDEHINRAVSLALMEMSLESRKPVAFGLLTCNTVEQAIHRSGGNVGNKGVETAEALVEMLRLATHWSAKP